MAKVNLTLPNGTEVLIEGSASDVAELVERLQGSGGKSVDGAKRKSRTVKSPTPRKGAGPMVLIQELIGAGFFDQRRTINHVQGELEQKGHIYPLTHLSTPLLRLVRSRALRRMKEEGQWVYVNA